MKIQRLLELDLVKAVAIFLMVFTHLAIFFYDFNSEFGNFISDNGGYLSFTLFLFVSAGTLPLLEKKYSAKSLRVKLLKRGIIFYLLYSLLAVFIVGIGSWFEVATLSNIPELADFLIAFALFFPWSILIIHIHRKFSWQGLLIFAAITYIIGASLNSVLLEGMLLDLKSLFAGHSDWHRFPVLQYTLVSSVGYIYVAHRAWFTTYRTTLLSLIISVAAVAAFQLTGFERWAPSLGFLLYGLSFIFLLLALWNYLPTSQSVNKGLEAVSSKVVGILVSHLFIVVAMSKVVENRFSLIVIVITTLLLIVFGMWCGRWLKF